MNLDENDNDNEIRRYLGEISESELYGLLTDSAGLGADNIDREAEGRVIFSRAWHKVRGLVCGQPFVQAYIKNPNVSDATAVAAQLTNLLIVIPGVNVVIVACLIVRIGLRKLCEGVTG
jgi:hypothetical protein